MSTKKQVWSWDGIKHSKLWILTTNKGVKRTYKPTRAEALKRAKADGLVVILIRPGTDGDLL